MGSAASIPEKYKVEEVGMSESNLRALVKAVRRLAIEGTGEKTAAKGVAVFVCPHDKLDFLFKKDAKGFAVFGNIVDSCYDFRSAPVKLDSDEGWKKLQICAREDGGIVVTPDNMIHCGNYFIRDTRKGSNEGGHGGRHLAVSAFSNTLDTLAIKVSEDSCGHNEKEIANATMKVFWRSHLAETRPVHAKEADAPPAAGSAAAARARRASPSIASRARSTRAWRTSRVALQRVRRSRTRCSARAARALCTPASRRSKSGSARRGRAPVVAVAVPDAAGADAARAALREADARLAEADAERARRSRSASPSSRRRRRPGRRPTPRPRPSRPRPRGPTRSPRPARAPAPGRIDMLTLEGHADDERLRSWATGARERVGRRDGARVGPARGATLRTLEDHTGT